MSYYKQLLELCEQIHKAAKHAEAHQKAAKKYKSPSMESICLGSEYHQAFLADGTPNPVVNDIRLAYIKSHQDQVIRYKSQLEGLRWKMAKLMREVS
jgi:hypothetical protein